MTGDHEERSQALFARSAPTGRSVAIFFRNLEYATESDVPPVLRLSLKFRVRIGLFVMVPERSAVVTNSNASASESVGGL